MDNLGSTEQHSSAETDGVMVIKTLISNNFKTKAMRKLESKILMLTAKGLKLFLTDLIIQTSSNLNICSLQ